MPFFAFVPVAGCVSSSSKSLHVTDPKHPPVPIAQDCLVYVVVLALSWLKELLHVCESVLGAHLV